MSGFGAAASLANFPLPSLPLDFRLLGPMLGPLPQAYDFEPLRGQPTHCKNPSQRVHQQTLPERHEFPEIGRKKFCWHQRLWILLTINDLSWVSNFKGECHQLPLEMMRIRYPKAKGDGFHLQSVTFGHDGNPISKGDGFHLRSVTFGAFGHDGNQISKGDGFHLQSVTFSSQVLVLPAISHLWKAVV